MKRYNSIFRLVKKSLILSGLYVHKYLVIKKTSLLFLVAMSGFCLLNYSAKSQSTDYWFNYIVNSFDNFATKAPFQKVFLHLDNERYNAGGRLWYKAYVYNSQEQKLDTISKNLYVEIIAPDKRIVMEQLLKLERGVAFGDFPILDSLSAGIYQIRAYTNNVRNFGHEFVFTTSFTLNNPKKIFFTKELQRNARMKKRNAQEIDLQFFPEGGNFIEGIKTNVGFKAINVLGKGLDVEGIIYSKKGKKIGEFKSEYLGIGKFEIVPVKGEKYYAVITKPENNKKYGLPKVYETGYTLNLTEKNDQIEVEITTNREIKKDKTANTIYLIAQSGGRIYFKEKIVLEKQTVSLQIPVNAFPTGIAHLTLFDGHALPHCERLFFINHHDFLTINYYPQVVGDAKDKVKSSIQVFDHNGKSVKTNLSVSILKKNETNKISEKKSNIKSHLLLDGDLAGKIENPEFYLRNTQDAKKAADLLMMTQGWRKFKWTDILADSVYAPIYGIMRDIRVSGRITKYLFNRKAKYANVNLIVLNKYNDIFSCNTGDSGRFLFEKLNYNDTLDILIEARTKNNGKNVVIIVDEDEKLLSEFDPVMSFYKDSLAKKRKSTYLVNPEKADTSQVKLFRPYGEADHVIKFDNPSFSGSGNILDALRGKVPGLDVRRGGVILRGQKSADFSNEPLYIVDGVEVDREVALVVNVENVDRVEILKGPSASIYGAKGGNGVIAIYTKRGHFVKRGELGFKMLGYHTPREFYEPKFDNEQSTSNITTLYWNPMVQTNAKGVAKITYANTKFHKNCELIIEAISDSGKVGALRIELPAH